MSKLTRAGALLARFDELVPVEETARLPSFNQFHRRHQAALNDTASTTGDEGRAIDYATALLNALGYDNDGGEWYDDWLHPDSEAEVTIQHGGYDGSYPTISLFGRNFKGNFRRIFSLDDRGAEQLYAFLKATAETPVLEESLAVNEDLIAAAKQALDIRPQPRSLTELVKLYPGDGFYTEDGAHHVHRYNGQVVVTDIADAMRAGRNCPRLVIMNRFGRDEQQISDFLYDQTNQGVRTLYDLFKKYPKETDVGDIRVVVSEQKAKGTFNPMRLGHIKPLNKLPNKFTNDHLIKVIANEQYDALTRDFRYTDDYAGDAAANFGRGDQLNPVLQIRDLVTRNATVSFSTELDGGRVRVAYGAHSNDSRSCVVNLKR